MFNLLPILLSLTEPTPCVVEVREPTTIYIDGLDMLLADGTDVTGCDFATRPGLVMFEATVDVIVELGDNEPALLRATESTAVGLGDYLIGFVGDPETCDEDICCWPVYIPFVGWTYQCSACAGGVGVFSNAGKIIEIAFEKPEPKW
jgi:hypothetical protein